MATLTDRLNQIKTEKKILQKDIAKNINISLRSYQRYETGEREPSASVLVALADYFGVSTDYLLGRTDNPEINK